MHEARLPRGSSRTAGFSLVELVIVIVIMGLIAAIALPRITRSAENADRTALRTNFLVLNEALEYYAAEHGGTYPTGANVQKQLTMCSDVSGANFVAQPDRANGIIFGPYLVRMPPVPMGPNAGATGIATDPAKGVGWLYKPARPIIVPNFLNTGGTLPPVYEEILDDLASGEANPGAVDGP